MRAVSCTFNIRLAGFRPKFAVRASGLASAQAACAPQHKAATSGLAQAAWTLPQTLTCALPHKRPPALVAACAGSLGQAARSLSLSLGAADGARPLSFGARSLLSLGERQLSFGARALSLRARALTQHARALTWRAPARLARALSHSALPRPSFIQIYITISSCSAIRTLS